MIDQLFGVFLRYQLQYISAFQLVANYPRTIENLCIFILNAQTRRSCEGSEEFRRELREFFITAIHGTESQKQTNNYPSLILNNAMITITIILYGIEINSEFHFFTSDHFKRTITTVCYICYK